MAYEVYVIGLEAIISHGSQCTLEGYVQDDRIEIYGVVDSVRDAHHRSCFLRYEYPSKLPASVRRRMCEAGERVIRAIGLDNCPFNIEFYFDRRKDHIWLLEINTRISRSHTPLFHMVDGVSHLKVMLDIAVGQEVRTPHRQGDFNVAAKFMVREFADGLVTRTPSEGDLKRFHEQFPKAHLEIGARPGVRLSAMPNQDQYSFEIADLFIGAQDRRSLRTRYQGAMNMLPFEISEERGGSRVSAQAR